MLITTTAPISEAVLPTTSEMIRPRLVDGDGYTTQFVLFSSSVGQTSSGVLRLIENHPADHRFPQASWDSEAESVLHQTGRSRDRLA